MIAGLSVLAVIPARGGSKGLPRKNIRPLAGRPLLAWTVDAARRSSYVDRVILSSDDEEIMAAARALGCEVPFRRPTELAQDDTPGVVPVLHAIAQLPSFDIVVLLQPTSPLRNASDVDGCLERMVASNAPACISMRAVEDHPYWTFACDEQGRIKPFVVPPEGAPSRRQDLPRAFIANGAVYAARTGWLQRLQSFETSETVGFEMPAERSLDIDTETDLTEADASVRGRVTQPARSADKDR